MLDSILKLSIFRANRVKTDFKMLTKTPKSPIERFNRELDFWAVPEEAKFFKNIRVGKKSDSAFFRDITSFYDKDKKLIKRCISGSDINYKIRQYKYSYETPKYRDISPHVISGRKITTKEYIKDNPDKNIWGKWKTTCYEEQFAYHFFEDPMRIKIATKLHTNKVIYDLENEAKRTCVMTEYPKNKGYEPKSAKKVMGFEIEMVNGMPEIRGYEQTPNVKIPSCDDFLAYRFLMGAEKQEALTRYFLAQKKLDDLGISVYTNKSNVSPDAIAHFASYGPEICWRSVNAAREPVVTAAHEVEHAWQYAQIGRLGKGTTNYERDCLRKFGEIADGKEREEAYKYLVASENYPSKTQMNYLESYKSNYLEKKARKAGSEAGEIYNVFREFLWRQFRFLPKNNYYL